MIETHTLLTQQRYTVAESYALYYSTLWMKQTHTERWNQNESIVNVHMEQRVHSAHVGSWYVAFE